MDEDLKHFLLIVTATFLFVFIPVYFFGPSKMQTCIKAGYEWTSDEFGESCVKAIPDLWNGE